MVRTYCFIAAIALILTGIIHVMGTANEASVYVVKDGVATAVIVVSPQMDVRFNRYLGFLNTYISEATGTRLPIRLPNQVHDQASIHLATAETTTSEAAKSALADKDGDSYAIVCGDNEIHLVGISEWGLRNAVFDFLERYVGVRWLFAGPDGEDVPKQSDILVPQGLVLQEPAFVQRVISPLTANPLTAPTSPYVAWAERNRLQGVYNSRSLFMHNMYNLFPVERFGRTNPEFYGRRVPGVTATTDWQPCFSIEGTVDAAVQVITEYFTLNPEATSYSLGVNDLGGFCEADPNHPAYPGRFNSVGLLNLSDVYCRWVNEVVERVHEVFLDKWFGLLAYDYVADPPSFTLHPRVVPFITKDRMTWIDEEIRALGHKHTEEWQSRANQLAWYDYMYGVHYVVPRVYPHLIAENLRYAKEHGVVAHYIEMYHNIADGPKPWLISKLLWDPYQDVDVLLDEWCERMVGAAAAVELRAFYDFWEDFWTRRIKESAWFQDFKTKTYLWFSDLGYVNLITEEDLTYSRQLLETVAAKAENEKQKKRAQLLLRAFEYSEASVLSYPHRPLPPLDSEATAMAFLDGLEDKLQERFRLSERRYTLAEEFASDPALRFLSSRALWDWTGWHGSEFWHLLGYLRQHENHGGPVTERVKAYARDERSPHRRLLAQAWQEALDTGLTEETSILQNGSFENGAAVATHWGSWIVSTGSIERTTEISRSGDASLLVNRLERGGPLQIFPVRAGLIAAQAHYYTPPSTTSGTITMSLQLRNSRGERLFSCSSGSRTLADTAGEWAALELFGDVPAEIDGQELVEARLVITVDNAKDAQVYIDDVRVHQFAFQEDTDSTGASEESPDLLLNSGFEAVESHIPDAWSTTAANRENRLVSASSLVAHTGEQSLRFTNDGSAYQMAWQDVSVEGNTVYELTAWVRGDAAAMANLYVEFYSELSRAGYLRGRGIDFDGLSSEWREVKINVQAPAAAAYARVYLRSKGQGDVFFDDVSFRRLVR